MIKIGGKKILTFSGFNNNKELFLKIVLKQESGQMKTLHETLNICIKNKIYVLVNGIKHHPLINTMYRAGRY